VLQLLREVEVSSFFHNDSRNELQQIFPALCRGDTLGNVACNLSRYGTTKLWDKLQEKLPSVTAPLNLKVLLQLIFMSSGKDPI